MVKLFTVKEMLELEKEANNSGLTYDQMMENAGKSLAEEIELAYSQLESRNIISVVGSGNNGGDAIVALTILIKNGWRGSVYIAKSRSDDDPLVRKFEKSGGRVIDARDDHDRSSLAELIDNCSVLIDGVFGTGIKLPLKGEVAEILSFIKTRISERTEKLFVVAVDCPSGVDCEAGEVADETFPADMTVTMAGVKSGLINTPAIGYLGELRIGNIGTIDNLNCFTKNTKFLLDNKIIKHYMPIRPRDAHKGTFGTALIIAGSVNYTGAALLAGMAAYRSGAGLVTLAVPAPLHAALAGQFPESTWILLPNEMGVISPDAVRIVRQNYSKATSLLIGPGFGLEGPTRDFVNQLFVKAQSVNQGDIGFVHKSSETTPAKLDKPMVIDADGLKLLSKIEKWYELISPESVLTPHPGEMSVLTGLSTDEIQSNRVETALNFSHKWGHVVVLKGAYTLVAAPDGRLAVVPVATSALAHAGTGDVLAGLIVGLRAQGVNAFESACAGAWIHATAGVLAAERLGSTASVIASDVLNAVPQAISTL